MEFKFLMIFTIVTEAIVNIQSSASQPNECWANAMPGFWDLMRGVDITKFTDYRNLHVGSDVLGVSCDSNLTWSNAHLPKKTFTVPDQISRFALNEQNNLHSPQIQLAHDMIDRRNILLSMGSPADRLIGACSRNYFYKAYPYDYYRNNASCAFMSSQVSVYSVELKRPSELLLNHDFVQNIINLTSSKYEQNVEGYRQFVEQYGKHYVERANLGGFLYWTFSIPDEYYRSTSDAELEDNFKASFLLFTGEKNVTKPKGYEEFCKNVEIWTLDYPTVRGGDEMRIDGKLESWFLGDANGNAVYSRPAITEYFLRPLEDLIGDENTRAQVKMAIEMYRIEAYLVELKVVYNAASRYYRPSDEDRVLLAKLQNFVELKNSFNMDAIEAIQNIDYLYSKVKDIDQLITDYYVTAGLKLQLAQSVCDRSAGLCPSKTILDQNREFEQLYREYELTKAGGTQYPLDIYHEFGKKAQVLGNRHRIQADLQNGLGASCEKCSHF